MPDASVLGTDAVSYRFRQDTRARGFQPYLVDAVPLISFMTVAELGRWALHRNWGIRRREELARFLERFAVVICDRPLCRTWAEVTESARRRGRPIQVTDAWLAATAVSLGRPLPTNNRADSSGVEGLRVAPA